MALLWIQLFGILFHPSQTQEKTTGRLKFKAMKREIYEFICPVVYLPYIFYADIENVTDDEIDRIEDVLSGYFGFSVKEEEPFFTYRNDFNNLGEDCVTLIALKND